MPNYVKTRAVALSLIQRSLVLLLCYVAVIIMAAVGYSWIEEKSLGQSLWWSSITGSTVGYGDEYPIRLGGRLLAVFLVNFVVLWLQPMITARITAKMIVDNDAFTHHEQEEIKQRLSNIEAMLAKITNEA